MNQPDEVLFDVVGGAGRITLNRPKALNALTRAMCAAIHDQLAAWASDDAVERVELRGAGERALCAGADIRALRTLVAEGGDWLGFFETEYAMNAAIARYPKPYVAYQSGIVMGGGLGVSAHGSRRLVDATSRLAMPETVIGFTPDVGIAYYLARAPRGLGLHVALTGDPFGAADAVALGLADTAAPGSTQDATLATASWIEDCYGGDDPSEIVGRLAQHADPDARAAAATIAKRCPLSVAVTLEAVRRAASLTVEQVLAQDLALARALIPREDFAEGVRAQVVDKDFAPRWSHAGLSEVTRAEVLACFG